MPLMILFQSRQHSIFINVIRPRLSMIWILRFVFFFSIFIAFLSRDFATFYLVETKAKPDRPCNKVVVKFQLINFILFLFSNYRSETFLYLAARSTEVSAEYMVSLHELYFASSFGSCSKEKRKSKLFFSAFFTFNPTVKWLFLQYVFPAIGSHVCFLAI